MHHRTCTHSYTHTWKFPFNVKANCVHVAPFHLHLPEHFTSPSICMDFQVSTWIFYWSQPECIKSLHGNMYALQRHPGTHRSYCSALLWSPCELHGYRLQGWEPMEWQLGQHFRGNWVACWTSPAILLITLCFHSSSFTPQCPPPPTFLSRLPRVRVFLICYRSCIVWLRCCWIQLPFLVSASGPLEIPSGIICVFVYGVCLLPVCVCLWVLIPLSVWIYFISAYLGWGCLCFACNSVVSQQFMSLWSMLANLCTMSVFIRLFWSGLLRLPYSRRYRVALC